MNFHQSQLVMLLKWKNHITWNFSSIAYNIHCWNICWDWTATALLVGMMLGFTNFYCFYVNGAESQKNNTHETPLHPKKIFLPLILITHGTMMNFVKVWTIMEWHLNFSSRNCHITKSKIKDGIFLGPQIKHAVRDKNFDQFKLLRKPFGRQFK